MNRSPARPWSDRDRALAARAALALTAAGVVSAAVVAALAVVDVRALWVVAAAAGLAALQLLAGARLALWLARARVASPEAEPALHAALERLCQLADVRKPRLAIAETSTPLAFAVRRPGDRGTVCLGRGLNETLPPEEVEAVIAHELAHLAHRDVLVMTVASSVAALAALLVRFYWWSGSPSEDNAKAAERSTLWTVARGIGWVLSPALTLGMIFVRIVAVVPGVLVLAVAALTLPPTAALSRAREYAADREGALLAGAPGALASALLRIETDMPTIPDRDLRSVAAVNGLLIQPTRSDGLFAWAILRSHPSTSARVAALLDLQRRLDAVPVA